MPNKTMEECLHYFRSRPVYDKLFRKVREKYAGLRHIGGTVTLTKLTENDKQQLGGFFKKDYHENRSVTISANLMQKALADSKFAGLRWEDILECYFGESLKTKQEKRQKEADRRREYFDGILQKMDAEARRWLESVLEKQKNSFQILRQQYKENPEKLEEVLVYINQAVIALPVWEKRKERLAVFAAGITGNPHYFDEGMLGERLLSACLQFIFPQAESGGTRTERKSSLLYAAGILKDDLSNFVLAYGIHGEEKGGKAHGGMAGFLEREEPVILTLYTISRLDKAKGQTGPSGDIYVVENPAVFSTLIEKYPRAAVICTNGQPRLAAFALMDMLKENHIFHYAGDFDPEGLGIAQNLKLRYGGKLVFWNYSTAYYEDAVSSVVLDECRLRKLDGIRLEELQEIKMAMLEKKRAAYQENMIEAYVI